MEPCRAKGGGVADGAPARLWGDAGRRRGRAERDGREDRALLFPGAWYRGLRAHLNSSLFKRPAGVHFLPKLSKFRVGAQMRAWAGVALMSSNYKRIALTIITSLSKKKKKAIIYTMVTRTI